MGKDRISEINAEIARSVGGPTGERPIYRSALEGTHRPVDRSESYDRGLSDKAMKGILESRERIEKMKQEMAGQEGPAPEEKPQRIEKMKQEMAGQEGPAPEEKPQGGQKGLTHALRNLITSVFN